MPDATDVRLAVASQPTVAQGIVALLRSFVSHVNRAFELDDPAPLKSLAVSLDTEAKAWTDAVLANTTSAPLSATLTEPVPVPAHAASAFTTASPIQTGTLATPGSGEAPEGEPAPRANEPASAPPHGEPPHAA
jgi:hypothetical protein